MAMHVNFHGSQSMKATLAVNQDGGEWVDIEVTDYAGRTTEITVFFYDRPGMAAAYADAINSVPRLEQEPMETEAA